MLQKWSDKVAAELGIDMVYSELLPADKVKIVEKLLKEKPEKSALVFVGDESMTPRFWDVRISESPWEPWDRMQRSRRRM